MGKVTIPVCKRSHRWWCKERKREEMSVCVKESASKLTRSRWGAVCSSYGKPTPVANQGWCFLKLVDGVKAHSLEGCCLVVDVVNEVRGFSLPQAPLFLFSPSNQQETHTRTLTRAKRKKKKKRKKQKSG